MERKMNEPTREEKAAAAQARMAELAAKFVDRSVGDLVTLRAGLRKIADGDAGPLEELRQLSHRMVGTGATLGFETVAQKAYDLETLAEGCAAGGLPDADLQARFASALNALEAELQRLRK